MIELHHLVTHISNDIMLHMTNIFIHFAIKFHFMFHQTYYKAMYPTNYHIQLILDFFHIFWRLVQ